MRRRADTGSEPDDPAGNTGTSSDFVTSLDRRLMDLICHPGYRPLRRSEIARALGLGPELRGPLRLALKKLEARGVVVRHRRNRYARPGRDEEITGMLTLHPRGFGFVVDEEQPSREAFIPSPALSHALHGDRVRVAIEPAREPVSRRRPSDESDHRWRGRVKAVIERPNPDLVGTVQQTSYYACVVPDDPRQTSTIRVRGSDLPDGRVPDAGRKVVIRLDAWSPETAVPGGRVIEDLGDAGDPAVALPSLLRRHRIADTFPPAAERQVRERSPELGPDDLAGRADLRGELAFTIDPEDARDFDDAVSIVSREGGWRLGVHIADVAHFVAPGTEVDREAARRGTTTYLADRAVTMLPGYLTTDLCSLRPGLDRLAHTVEMDFRDDGHLVCAHTRTSVIRSRARLDYRAVQAFFTTGEDPGWPAGVADSLGTMRILAARLRKRRMDHGALDLQTPEIRCRLDDTGRVLSIERRTEEEAYHLIEEFMLQANQAVARRLGAAGSPSLYRIHDEPDEKQWEAMDGDLAALGFTLTERSRSGLNHALRAAACTPLAYPATLAVLRNLKRALYHPHRRPHFGLAFEDYVHFTSPIRRYPDLLVHRLLLAVESHTPPPFRNTELKELAVHCSRREREADEAERESVEIKRLEYYQARLERGETGPWTVLVVSMVPRGFIVEIPETLQRGLVPFASLPGGHSRGSSSRARIRARGANRGIGLGSELSVRLVRVDLRRRFVDFLPEKSSAEEFPRAETRSTGRKETTGRRGRAHRAPRKR